MSISRRVVRRSDGGPLILVVLNANHLRRILDGNDREAIWAVEKAFGTVRRERSPEVITKYEKPGP